MIKIYDSVFVALVLAILTLPIHLIGQADDEKIYLSFDKHSAEKYCERNLDYHFFKFKASEIVNVLDTTFILIKYYELDQYLYSYHYFRTYHASDYKRDIDKAINESIKAIEYAHKNGTTEQEIDFLLMAADLYKVKNDKENLFKCLKKAQKLALSIDDQIGLAYVKISLAGAHGKHDDYSLNLYRESYNVLKHIETGINLSVSSNNFGEYFMYHSPPMLDSAIHYLSMSKINQDSIGTKVMKIDVDLAHAYFLNDQIDMALGLLEELDIQQDDEFYTYFMAWVNVIESYEDYYIGDIRSAKEKLNASIPAILEILEYSVEFQSISSRGKLLAEKISDQDLKLKFDSIYYLVTDSLLSFKENSTTSLIQSDFMLSEKDEIISEHVKISQLQNLLIYTIVTLLLFTVGLFYLILKQLKMKSRVKNLNQGNKKAESKIETLKQDIKNERFVHQERQLSSNVVHLAQKNKILEDVLKKVNKITNDDLSLQQKNTLKEIINLIKPNLKSNDQVEKFLMHFENIHPVFYKNIYDISPTLSSSDKRLLAYLKMNLSSKEIAQITGVNHGSINTARYRLRKKLNLSKEISLESFVAGL